MAELRGDILIRKRDSAAAYAAYTEAQQAEDASQTLQMKLDDLAKKGHSLMKELFNHALVAAGVLALLAGCASEEENVIKAPLPVVKSEFTPKTLWSAAVGEGVGHNFSKLAPDYAYDKVFVASRDVVVKHGIRKTVKRFGPRILRLKAQHACPVVLPQRLENY